MYLFNMEKPESNLDLPIEKMNSFLENHEFILDDLFLVQMNDMKIAIKLKILKTTKLISVGEWTDYVVYQINVRSLNKKTKSILGYLFPKGGEATLTTSDNQYFRLTYQTDKLLTNFLKYWGYDASAICAKIINDDFEKISESFIFESKMDSVTRKLVSDIIKLVKTNKNGSYDLPSDISEEITYSFPQLQTEFSIELNVSDDETVEPFVADAEFSRDDDTIFITIKFNPKLGNTVLSELTGELNELLAHELTHIKQYEEGYIFPKEPKKPKKYYSQEHELEAQLTGFKRKAKITGKKLEDVVNDWFETNKSKHRLKPNQAKKIIDKVLQYNK